MTSPDEINIEAAKECIRKSLSLIEEVRNHKSGEASAKESNIRHSFTSYLRLIFPSVPWWVEDHISRGEANSAFSIGGKETFGFVDNLVGLSAIEYESDLENVGKFNEGIRQVKNYCASLLNSGHDPDLVIGVLSDTVRWRAYRIGSASLVDGMVGGEHLELEEIDRIDLSSADEVAVNRLVHFLLTHLGRKGSRPLSAETIAKDLGFDSAFCLAHAASLQDLVEKALEDNPKYAELIAKLWCSFVTYLRDQGSTEAFEKTGYADELYILTLAKLVCANVIEEKALLSDDFTLETILDGRYFKSKGLINLVEYDYFGWLNRPPFIEDLLPIARGIQADLEAYDFASPTAEDLFGRLMAQLAKRTQRLLLGQEWTPSWLASHIVGNVFSKLPSSVDPQLVDMCCGSGAMIVEAIKKGKERIESSGETLGAEQKLQKLSQVITGFDIDPLAVMLSKISWILASRDWLKRFRGGLNVSIPIYHADSLFAITPLSSVVDAEAGRDFHTLQIAEYTIELPSFLLSPEFQLLFDATLDRSYAMATAAANGAHLVLSAEETELAVDSACTEAGCKISSKQRDELATFFPELVRVIDALNRDGRNGIWVFVLRNSYRPGLVARQFNGLVSNPPWLALSKIADNPYKDALRQRAEAFSIKPTGSSHLHIELATIFLLHAVDRYLEPRAAIGCIVPDTVLNGHHHNPFRSGAYSSAERSVEFTLDEIWRVQKGTFKNEACVLFGRKVPLKTGAPGPIPGALAEVAGLSPLEFERIERGKRVVWSDSATAWKGKAGFFNPAPFRQGADIMPRTLLFHEVAAVATSGGKRQWNVRPIDKSTSRLRFVVKDSKKNKTFKVTPSTVPDRIVFDVLTSNLLTPFELVAPLKAVLPIEKSKSGKWGPISAVALAATPSAKMVIDEILAGYGNGKTIQDLFDALDSDRKKLTQQQLPTSGYLVFTGAGGKWVCGVHAPVAAFNIAKLIVDQTLYWAAVETEDEAIYLTGLFNSDAINRVIQDFQPRGAFGERHVHKLAHEATPPFDPLQAAHQDVVQQARTLLVEYAVLKARDKELVALLDPNTSTLAARRRKIRMKIRKLPSYEAYELACRNLYGV